MSEATRHEAKRISESPGQEAEWADRLLKQVSLFEEINAEHRVEGECLSRNDALWLTVIFIVLPCIIAAAMWMFR